MSQKLLYSQRFNGHSVHESLLFRELEVENV